MPIDDPDRILALLRDPNVGSQEVADETGLPRAECARAATVHVGGITAIFEDFSTVLSEKLPLFIGVVLLLGLLVGSFLNVCILRWPAEESVIRPRSRCPKCAPRLPRRSQKPSSLRRFRYRLTRRENPSSCWSSA